MCYLSRPANCITRLGAIGNQKVSPDLRSALGLAYPKKIRTTRIQAPSPGMPGAQKKHPTLAKPRELATMRARGDTIRKT
jgi:hypothetical protein